MLRAYQHPISSTKRQNGVLPRKSRSKAILLVAGIAIFALVQGPANLSSFARKLASRCLHKVVVTTKTEALNMPNVPYKNKYEPPSYISMCQELLRRDASAPGQDLSAQPLNEVFRMYENVDICMDWTSPHYSLMDMLASYMLSTQLPRIKYWPGCDNTRTWDEASVGFDRTTLQQIFPVPQLPMDNHEQWLPKFVEQCKICLSGYSLKRENKRVRAKSTHHCLAWPEDNEIFPMSAIMEPLRKRLEHIGAEFWDTSGHRPNEDKTTALIYIEPSSSALSAAQYQTLIPDGTETIVLLAPLLCATAVLPNGQECLAYLEQLKLDLTPMFPATVDIGYEMSTSSASLFSRLTMAKTIICPPYTPTCLFPAASKVEGSVAKLIEIRGEYRDPTDFFELIKPKDRVEFIRLKASDIPAAPAPQPVTLRRNQALVNSHGVDAAKEFTYINEPVDSSGMMASHSFKYKTRAEVATITSQQVLDTADIPVKSGKDPNSMKDSNPNAMNHPQENVPSKQAIDGAVVNKTYIDGNYYKPSAKELAVDVNVGLKGRPADDALIDKQQGLRKKSVERIQAFVKEGRKEEWEESGSGTTRGVDGIEHSPMLRMELFCPEIAGASGVVDYDGGVVETKTGTEVTVSDGVETVVFDQGSLTETTADIPVDAEGNPYTQLTEPNTGDKVLIEGKPLKYNTGSGMIRKTPVGAFVVNHADMQGTLLTEGSSGTFDEGLNKQIVDSGTVIAAGSNNVGEDVPVRFSDAFAVKKATPNGEEGFEEVNFDKDWVEDYKAFNGGRRNRAKKYWVKKNMERKADPRHPSQPVATPPRNLIYVGEDEIKFGHPDELKKLCEEYRSREAAQMGTAVMAN